MCASSSRTQVGASVGAGAPSVDAMDGISTCILELAPDELLVEHDDDAPPLNILVSFLTKLIMQNNSKKTTQLVERISNKTVSG